MPICVCDLQCNVRNRHLQMEKTIAWLEMSSRIIRKLVDADGTDERSSDWQPAKQ